MSLKKLIFTSTALFFILVPPVSAGIAPASCPAQPAGSAGSAGVLSSLILGKTNFLLTWFIRLVILILICHQSVLLLLCGVMSINFAV
jgi:hypothetical protein